MVKSILYATAALIGLAASAQAAIFNFDDMALLDTTISSVTTDDGSITAQLTTLRQVNRHGRHVEGIAAIFDTENPSNAFDGSDGDGDPDLTQGSDFAGSDFGGALIISELNTTTAGIALEPADDNRYGGSIRFDFGTTLVNLVSFDILDDATLTVRSGNDLSSYTVNGDGSFANGLDLSIFKNVSAVTFDFSGSGAIDNFEVAAISVVPLPGTLPLLIASFGGLGIMRRRRKAA